MMSDRTEDLICILDPLYLIGVYQKMFLSYALLEECAKPLIKIF